MQGQVATAVAGQEKTDKTDRLEYLSYKEEDLAGNSRATDVSTARCTNLVGCRVGGY